MLPNDFLNDKGQELLSEVRLELALIREMPQTADLLGFSFWIAQRQPVLGLQFADCAGTLEPLRQHVDDCGIDIIDATAQGSKARQNGISGIHQNNLSLLSSFCEGASIIRGKLP